MIRITNASYTPTNTIDVTGSTLSTTVSTPLVGATIYKRGVTTGTTSGTVNSTSASVTMNGVLVTDLIQATSSSGDIADFGDSGGVTYNSSYYTVGIVTGGIINNHSIGYFSKATNILSAFNASRY